jgi:shikimate dehydrogenase
MSLTYGIIGYPLTHSFSPGYFTGKFMKEGIDAVYRAFEIQDIDALPGLLKDHQDLKGLNVTIPYKQSVIPFLDAIDDTAAAVGAVNCIAINNGHTKGYNTDIIGFSQSLQPLLQSLHTQALILGTGGGSYAVAHVLDTLSIPYKKVSRKKQENVLTYDELNSEMISEYKLIINTTPLGMYPSVEACPPIPYKAISTQHLLYDLIYNPALTQFLRMGQEHGAAVKNGMQMLEIQAEESWNIWNDYRLTGS